jgi:hypothetical protein
MYPLESIYGPCAYRAFKNNGGFPENLTHYRQNSDGVNVNKDKPPSVNKDKPLNARSYEELVDIVSFLSVMNKRHTLYYRGQRQDWPLCAAIFRRSWTSLSGTHHSVPDTSSVLKGIWDHLNSKISFIIRTACEKLPMPRHATLRMFREAVWAVAQHYELWPTPLIDITPSLRIATSFALWDGHGDGYLYVVALPASTNSVTFDADQHVALARLQAVCPPVAKRPHYQDGFLAGRFPFESPVSNIVDKRPAKVSDLARRLVARIYLTDADDVVRRRDRRPSGNGFWSHDFPRMSDLSLMPKDDPILDIFAKHAAQIDDAMREICGT